MEAREKDEIIRANADFYKAFESLDMRQMEQVWLQEDYVQCFHPGWGPLRGWKPVMVSWRRIFENTVEMQFLLTDVQVEIRGSIAVVTLCENLTTRVGDDKAMGVVLATNVFERRFEKWLMIHHHGSTVVNPLRPSGPETVH